MRRHRPLVHPLILSFAGAELIYLRRVFFPRYLFILTSKGGELRIDRQWHPDPFSTCSGTQPRHQPQPPGRTGTAETYDRSHALLQLYGGSLERRAPSIQAVYGSRVGLVERRVRPCCPDSLVQTLCPQVSRRGQFQEHRCAAVVVTPTP
jgi:hypothetical protein